MKRFLTGIALGVVGCGVALALGIAPPWALLIGVGIAAVVWLRLYRLDKLLDTVLDSTPNPFD